MSYLRYLCLFVGGHMSYLRYLCLFAGGHIHNVSKTCDLLDHFGNCRITYISVCNFSVCLTDILIYKEMKLELNNHI
jgi:hypothetical protein